MIRIPWINKVVIITFTAMREKLYCRYVYLGTAVENFDKTNWEKPVRYEILLVITGGVFAPLKPQHVADAGAWHGSSASLID